jgi:HK97 family phage portal protein
VTKQDTNANWNRVWGDKATTPEVKTTSITIPAGSFLAYALGGGGYITSQQAMNFYRTNSSVATAVDLISEAIEQITPVLQMEDGTFVTEHPVLDLLRNPNGFQTWLEYIGQVSHYYLLKHDSHLGAIGSVRTAPIELWSATLVDVMPQEDVDLYPRSYNVTQGPVKGNYLRNRKGRGNYRFFDGTLKELFHIMGFSSRSSQIQGDSPLQAAANDVRQQIEGRTHNLKLIKNGARLSLVMMFKDDKAPLDDDEHKERVQQINEQIGGAENAGKPLVVSNADFSTIQEMSQSNKDMDYSKLDETATQVIYMRYGIPLPLISTKASTFNNMQTAIGIFYDRAVIPVLDKILSGHSSFLLPRYGLDPAKVKITYDPESIPVLRARMLDELEKRGKIGVETANELRSMIPNREPLDGGDTLYISATQIPLGESLELDDEDVEPDEDANIEEGQ